MRSASAEPRRPRRHRQNEPRAPDYGFFISKYDEAVAAQDLCERRKRWAARLPRQAGIALAGSCLAPREPSAAPVDGAAEFAPRSSTWKKGGSIRLGSRALSSIPCTRSLSSAKRIRVFATVVTLLLDRSGSMRGRPITVAATCADILARTLERCGVKVEFSGSQRVRGKAVNHAKPGSPPASLPIPGVLMIYATSSTSQPTRPGGARAKSRTDDARGAVERKHRWRGARLGASAPAGTRRTAQDLMMISDGAPVDDSNALGRFR